MKASQSESSPGEGGLCYSERMTEPTESPDFWLAQLISDSQQLTTLKSELAFITTRRNQALAILRSKRVSYRDLRKITGLGLSQLSRIVDDQVMRSEQSVEMIQSIPSSLRLTPFDETRRKSKLINPESDYVPNEIETADDWQILGRPKSD